MSSLYEIKKEKEIIKVLEKHSGVSRYMFSLSEKRNHILKVIEENKNRGFQGRTPKFMFNLVKHINNKRG